MAEEILVAQAQTIAEKLNDPDGIWFYYKAIKILGFDTCYQLCSLTLDKHRRGEIKTTPGAYYNGCVAKEIRGRSSHGA